MIKLSLLMIMYVFGVQWSLFFAQVPQKQIEVSIPLNDEETINNPLNSSNFETFLNKFLLTTYSEKKFDSLVYASSPLIMDFTSKNLGFGRFWNMGAYCNLYKSKSNHFGYNFNEKYFGEIQPQTTKLKFFAEQKPIEGFCEEATSPDGIYYQQVNDLPRDWDMAKDVSVPTSAKLKKLNKKVVYIQFEKWIKKTFYFVQSGKKWFLIYVDDCDCSA